MQPGRFGLPGVAEPLTTLARAGTERISTATSAAASSRLTGTAVNL
jgi:hypothetical protein